MWLLYAWFFLIGPLLAISIIERLERGPEQTIGAWCRTGRGAEWSGTFSYDWCESAASIVIDSHNSAKHSGSLEAITYCEAIQLNEPSCTDFRENVLYAGNIQGIEW